MCDISFFRLNCVNNTAFKRNIKVYYQGNFVLPAASGFFNDKFSNAFKH